MLQDGHGSVYRKYRIDIRYLKKIDTDTDVGIWYTEKYRILAIKYRKVGSVRYFSTSVDCGLVTVKQRCKKIVIEWLPGEETR